MIPQICMLLPFYRRVLSRPRHQWHLSGSLSLFFVPLSRCCCSFIHSSKAHWSLSEYVMCPWRGCSVIRVIQPKMLGFDYTAGTRGREGQKDNKMSPVWRRCWSWMIRSVITNQEMRVGWLANRHWLFFIRHYSSLAQICLPKVGEVQIVIIKSGSGPSAFLCLLTDVGRTH